MNIDEGAMDFEAIMNNDKFIKAIDEAEKRVKGFSSSTVAEGEKIDEAFKITAENIKIQKDIIAGLEGQLNNLNIEISKLPPGKAQAELKQQAAEVSAELNAEKDALKFLESQVQATEKAHISFRTQLRNAREELIQMEAAGLRGTDAYNALQQKVGELKDAMDDAQQQANVLANDEKGFQGVVSALSGVTGAMSAAQGAVGLFAGENENLNKIMLKVQSLMAITIGLQQVAQTLNKDSYFSVVLLAKGKTMLAAATTGLASALGISTVAAQALMATLTLGLSVAITAVAVLVTKFIGKSNEAKKATEEFNKSIVDLAAKPIAAIKQLSIEWAALGDNMQAKEKYLQTHKNLFDELSKSINSVKKAEELLSDPKHIQSFIDAQISKAKAIAANQQATELAKEALINDLKLDEAKKTPKVTRYISTGMYGAGYSDEIDNPEIKKLEAKSLEINNKITELYKSAIKYEQEGSVNLKNAGIEGVDEYTKGSITALENSISKLNEKYKDAATDKERANLLKQIKAQEKVLDKMDQSDSSSSNKDTFKDKLDKRKKLYQDYFKWVNSGFENEAKVEFSNLLKKGTSYKDYLENMLKNEKLNKDQIKQVRNELSNETQKTVLQDFETALQKQMNSATSVLQMLDIIAQKRKELSGDGSDLDTGKKEILDKADQSTQEQAKEETNKLIEDYASYLTKKFQLQQKYTDDMILLEKRLKEAQDANNPEDVAKIQGAISNRKEQYAKDSKLSGDSDYDAMVVQYRNFEQKKQAIIDEFDEKRKKAQEHGNTQLVEELNKAQAKALSSLASDELMKSADWNKLFGDLDKLSVDELQKLINKIETNKASLGVKLSPEDLKTIQDKVDQAKKEIETKNPFKALLDGIKEYSNTTDKAAKKDSFKKMFESASASIDLVKGAFDSVVGGLDKMGVSMDDQTKAVLNDISGIAQGASTLAQGIATGNPLAIIQGSIDIISNGIDLIWGSKDRKLEKQINQHKEAVEALTDAYSDLERAVDKALGGDTYKNQKQMIANLQEQRANYLEMIRLEEDKKKTDKDKIKEYENAYKEAGQTIEDVLEEISQDILQTNAKDFADQLGDAIVEAFGKGEDAATAFGDTVNDIMKNAVLNQLKKNFLQKQLDSALKQLEDDMGYWNGDNFVFDGLTEEEQAKFKAQIAAIGQNFNSVLGAYGDLFKGLADEVDDSSLSGGIKGVSEETASKLSGQINAMRINQAESLTVLRNQLMVLNQIAANTSYNKYLFDIRNDINDIKNKDDGLRSSGLS
jgi:hypothetical protein